jgi:hypothetical protein
MTDTSTPERIRMQYLGVLQLLGNVMAYVPRQGEGQDWHDAAVRAFNEAMEAVPNLKVIRSISRYDLEIMPSEHGKKC